MLISVLVVTLATDYDEADAVCFTNVPEELIQGILPFLKQRKARSVASLLPKYFEEHECNVKQKPLEEGVEEPVVPVYYKIED